MDNYLKTSVKMQFGAALDMLAEALNTCPDELWTAILWADPDDPRYGQFWYIAYHSIVWMDLFFTGSSEGFQPPAPFIRGKLPENPYTKEAVLNYLNQCRQKSYDLIEALSDEQAQRLCSFPWMELSYLELQLYSMRHLQEHSSQLRFFLGQKGISTNDWVARA